MAGNCAQENQTTFPWDALKGALNKWITKLLSDWFNVPETEDCFRLIDIVFENEESFDIGYRSYHAKLDTGCDFNAIKVSLLKDHNGAFMGGPHQLEEIGTKFVNADGTDRVVTEVFRCSWRGHDKRCQKKLFFIDKTTKRDEVFYVLPMDAPHDVIIGLPSILKHGFGQRRLFGGAGFRQLRDEPDPGAEDALAQRQKIKAEQRKDKQKREMEDEKARRGKAATSGKAEGS